MAKHKFADVIRITDCVSERSPFFDLSQVIIVASNKFRLEITWYKLAIACFTRKSCFNRCFHITKILLAYFVCRVLHLAIIK